MPELSRALLWSVGLMFTWISNRGIVSYVILNHLDASKGVRATGIQEAKRITNDAHIARPCDIFKATQILRESAYRQRSRNGR
jgi:hypothetical protein